MALSNTTVSALLFGTVAAGALAAAAALVFAPHTSPQHKADKISAQACQDIMSGQRRAESLQILECHIKNGLALQAH